MILFGASGHCKSVIDIAESIGEKIEFIYDDNPKEEEICNISVKKFKPEKYDLNKTCIISVGNNEMRKNISMKLRTNFGILIHRLASVSKYASVGTGSVIMAKTVVNACVTIGKHCIINSGAVIEHDCSLGDFAHISPNSSLAGGVSVGEGAHIGIGAVVLPEIKIGKWATIGAGAIILNDVPDRAVVVGNPGRIIKYNN